MAKNYAYGKQITEILCTKSVPSWVTDNDYLWVSLHTDDPDEGNQSTYEVYYDNYARQPIERVAGAWIIGLSDARNKDEVVFPKPTGGAGDEVWYVGVGLAETGAGTLLISSNVLDPVYTVSVSEDIVIPAEGLRIRER